MITGVPQGSVLGPLLFNIYLNDLFLIFESTDACNYADDTTLHKSDPILQTVLDNLEQDSCKAIKWFEDNYMKFNADKCHLLIAGLKHEKVSIKVGDEIIESSDEEKLLGILIVAILDLNIILQNFVKKQVAN